MERASNRRERRLAPHGLSGERTASRGRRKSPGARLVHRLEGRAPGAGRLLRGWGRDVRGSDPRRRRAGARSSRRRASRRWCCRHLARASDPRRGGPRSTALAQGRRLRDRHRRPHRRGPGERLSPNRGVPGVDLHRLDGVRVPAGSIPNSTREARSRMRALLLLLLAIQPDYEPAKEFEARDLAGSAIRLSELKGRVVVLNFWGIWCKSCRQEIPHLSALDREWRERGLVVLGADYGDAPEDLAPFVKELEMSYPVLVDDGLADEYDVLVYPTSVVIDRKGLTRLRVEGYREESFEDMKSLVERLLEEK